MVSSKSLALFWFRRFKILVMSRPQTSCSVKDAVFSKTFKISEKANGKYRKKLKASFKSFYYRK